jgi:hypothetical protein
MSTGGRARWSRAGRTAALAVAGVLAAGAVGCGSEEDFPNEPRPPEPIDVTAKVDTRGVVVSPDEFGAGLVVMTVANLSNDPVRFAVDGPTTASTTVIAPDGVGSLKTALEEGVYEATAGDDLKSARIDVGPPRKSSQNDLLLP